MNHQNAFPFTADKVTSETPRTVFVVLKAAHGRGTERFIPAEPTRNGTPREYATLAEAKAAAARLGGVAAGVSVFTEFRNAQGLPCAGHYFTHRAEPT